MVEIILLSIFLLMFVWPYTSYPFSLLILSKLIRTNKLDFNAVSGNLPKISVVVPAFNEASCIKDKIINIGNQKYPQSLIELVIASDGSTDDTVKIANDSIELVNCKVVIHDYKMRSGKVNVLNRTVPTSTGEIIVFTDANAEFNDECLASIAKRFIDPKVGCVTGKKGVNSRKGSNEGLYWKFEGWLKRTEGEIGIIPGAEGAIYAMRKELFEPVPARTAVDDFLISVNVYKANKKIVFENRAVSIENDVDSIDKEWVRKKRIAAGSFYNLTKTLFLWNFLKHPLVFYSFISHKVLRWFSPFLTIAIFALSISAFRFHKILILPGIGLIFANGIMIYGLNKLKSDKEVSKLISIVTYFFFTVWAQLFGFFDFFRKKQNAIWKKTR